MSTLFQRHGAKALGKITRDFFAAAGHYDADGEPPAGATVGFDAFFRKFGLAKPRVRSATQLARTYSETTHSLLVAEWRQRQSRAARRGAPAASPERRDTLAAAISETNNERQRRQAAAGSPSLARPASASSIPRPGRGGNSRAGRYVNGRHVPSWSPTGSRPSPGSSPRALSPQPRRDEHPRPATSSASRATLA